MSKNKEIAVLDKLDKLNKQLVIDDFGNNYSSSRNCNSEKTNSSDIYESVSNSTNTTEKIIDAIDNLDQKINSKTKKNNNGDMQIEKLKDILKNQSNIICSNEQLVNNLEKNISDIRVEIIKIKKMFDFMSTISAKDKLDEIEKKMEILEKRNLTFDVSKINKDITEIKDKIIKINFNGNSCDDSKIKVLSESIEELKSDIQKILFSDKFTNEQKMPKSDTSSDDSSNISNKSEKNKKIMEMLTKFITANKTNIEKINSKIDAVNSCLNELKSKNNLTELENKINLDINNIRNKINTHGCANIIADFNTLKANLFTIDCKFQKDIDDIKIEIKNKIEICENSNNTSQNNILKLYKSSTNINIQAITENTINGTIIDHGAYFMVVGQLVSKEIKLRKSYGVITIDNLVIPNNCEIIGTIEIYNSEIQAIYPGFVTNKNFVDSSIEDGKIIFVLSNRPVLSICLTFTGYVKLDFKIIK